MGNPGEIKIADRVRSVILGDPQRSEHSVYKYGDQVLSTLSDPVAQVFQKLDIQADARIVRERPHRWSSWTVTAIYDQEGNPLESVSIQSFDEYVAGIEGRVQPANMPVLHDPNGLSRERVEGYLNGVTTMREGICYEPVSPRLQGAF